MTDSEFKSYIEDRYQHQVDWYDRKAGGDIVKCCGRGGSGGALFDQFSILEFLSF